MTMDRDTFRKSVFARDAHKCVICKKPAKDAHHITERRLFPTEGPLSYGYHLDNGASLCEEHHVQAEQTILTCEEIRAAAKIEKVILPPHFYRDERYDKWGNPFLQNGLQRVRGELYDDESVQKVLPDHVKAQFTKYVKYPRTWHLPWSPGGTDDDRILPSTDVFAGRKVVVTVKMDGECLSGSTKITMADLTSMSIRNIVKQNMVGARVLGTTEDGQIIESKITKVYNNGPTEEWLRIETQRARHYKKYLYCTPQELFFVKDKGYVSASSLIGGETVRVLDKTLDLAPLQEQVLLGLLLGDASLHITCSRQGQEDHSRQVAFVQWGQKKTNIEYIEWTRKALGRFACSEAVPYISGFGTEMLKISTTATHSIYEKFYKMIVDGKKSVPETISNQITPISLAFWYMDDGSLIHTDHQQDRVQISTCDFSKKDCESLCKAMGRFGIEARIGKYDYNYIEIRERSAELFFMLVAPYVPNVMQYKLPLRYRGHQAWLPSCEECDGYRPWLREVKIKSITKKSHHVERIKYDLGTETHNFFANGVLVHNCTTMYNDYMHARSVTSEMDVTKHWAKSLQVSKGWAIPEGWRVCGENLYAKHSILYKELPTYFMVFSIWNEKNECLSWELTKEWAELLEMAIVPTVYEGEYDEDLIKGLYHPKFSGNEMEGYVVRLADSFHYRDFKRSVGKFVRKNHVQTSEHWKRGVITMNKLEDDK